MDSNNFIISVKYFTVTWPDSGAMNLSVFVQCQFRRAILRNKNIGEILVEKHSKFQNIDETFCGTIRLRNTNLDVFIQCHYTRTIWRKKNMGQNLFKKHSKYLILIKIFNCDMTKTLGQNFYQKTSKLV